MNDRLTRMLDLQRHVCAVVDVDPQVIGTGVDAHQELRMDRWKTWHLACISELIEALDETGWKRHTTSDRFDQEKAFGELRDAMQFLIDLMFLATGLPADELAEKLFTAMESKSKINLARKAANDDGIARRCPGCGRSTDEVYEAGVAACTPGWCVVYGAQDAVVR